MISKKYCNIKKLRLHLAETQDFSPKVMRLLEEHFDLSTGSLESNELVQTLREVDVFWFRLGYKLNAAVLDVQTRCKYLVTPVTGIDHIDEDVCERLGIQIICLRGETEFLKEVRATAEHTILLAMALMRRAVFAINDAHAGNWRRDFFRGYELQNKKVGIIGYGRLGQIVAKYFQTFGCEVGFYDIVKKTYPPNIRSFESIVACIEWSDIVSLHVPYNTSTHHLFNWDLLNHFTANKWLINTSRGGVVDEISLLDCLKNNKIAGAALDVLFGEPEVVNHPLIIYAKENRNLIITPHIGGCTFESFEKTEAFIMDKLLKALDHQLTT